MFFVYNAVAYACIVWAGRISGLYAVVALVVLAFGAGFLTWTFSTHGSRKFEADASGITLAEQKLSWSDIAQLRITGMRTGARLEVLLTPAAPVSYRSPLGQAADLVLMGFPYFRGRRFRRAIQVPRPDPPRYLIPLLQVTTEELRAALARLAPGTPIEVKGDP
jgi:hypothetical protein